MKIVIAGAGEVGFNLAQLLSRENQDITLIDEDEEVLAYASSHLDVMTVQGDVSALRVLSQCEMNKVNLFISVTTSESTNILSAILARKLGATQTIARVNNPDYLLPDQLKLFEELGISTMISPQQMAAEEIARLLHMSSFTDVAEFEGGKLMVVGLTVGDGDVFAGKSAREIYASFDQVEFRILVAVRRGVASIAKGDEILYPGDHIYLSAGRSDLDKLNQKLGRSMRKLSRVMILGGSSLAEKTARLLESKYKVTVIAGEKLVCKKLIGLLKSALVVHADPGNTDVLIEEGIDKMDAFIALTDNSETNIIGSLVAEQMGVKKTIAHVDNAVYTQISHNIGVDTLINKKLIAANNIFRFVRKGRVEAIASLQDADIEIIEYVVHRDNRLTRKPIADLHFPGGAVIAGVIRNNVTLIPDGELIFEKGDRVIVLAQNGAVTKVEALFK